LAELVCNERIGSYALEPKLLEATKDDIPFGCRLVHFILTECEGTETLVKIWTQAKSSEVLYQREKILIRVLHRI